MPSQVEFFIPHNTCDLDDPSKACEGQYHFDNICEFDVPSHQQLDDLTRLFDQLHREKSPTALLSKPELFFPLYGYIKGIAEKDSTEKVNKLARHKICHEVAEKMKKLLLVCQNFLKKQTSGTSDGESREALQLCLRSALKIYCFIICTILSSCVHSEDSDEASQRDGHVRRKRRREMESGFGEDDSGVDLDGREQSLNSLIEMFSPEIVSLWPNSTIEGTTLHLVFRMCLHMVTQKSNIGGDAQCISSAISLLLARAMGWMNVLHVGSPNDLSFPLVDVSLKSESAVLFLSKLVSDIEADEGDTDAKSILISIFESMTHAALHDAPNDGASAKNIAVFFSEVSKRSVSLVQRFSNLIFTIIQSESYDIRKSAITSMSELIIQKYAVVAKGSIEERNRAKCLSEILFRLMDVNLFVRNHTLHIWEKLIESKSVPRSFYVSVTDAVVGRLEDKSYLVRGSAMSCISNILKRMWFGQVLNSGILLEKMSEAHSQALQSFPDKASFEDAYRKYKLHHSLQDASECLQETFQEDDEESTIDSTSFEPQQLAAFSKVFFYESALKFIALMKKAVSHAVLLLDSKTERDAIESIQLIVTVTECRLDGNEAACLKMIVLVFHSEPKVQLAVRDAFSEIFFSNICPRSANLQNLTPLTKTLTSAHKLIRFLCDAREGEVSAIDRIFNLLKLSPSQSRHLTPQLVQALWEIAGGTFDSSATAEERRTAMRIYGLLNKHTFRGNDEQSERVVSFLQSNTPRDNLMLSYVFNSLENSSANTAFKPLILGRSPLDYPLLTEIIRHLCRRTSALSSWMCMANAGVNAIHCICDNPLLIYGYILSFLKRCVDESRDENTRAQLCFLVGCTAVRQLISVESAEKRQLKMLEEPSCHAPQEHTLNSDTIQKDLGLGSIEYRRHAIQEMTVKKRKAILEHGSIWESLSHVVVSVVNGKQDTKLERVCAVVALCQLMIVDERFCEQQLQLLFSIVSTSNEDWVVKTNIVIALGDLACVHPNLLAPYLVHATSGLFKLLKDDDLRVRSVTIQVCSHLVLGEMLRIKEHLYSIVKLVADPDEAIAHNAVVFIRNLASKEKERTGNLIPPLVTKLGGMPQKKFRVAMRTLLEQVEGDKPTESLIDRLCQRFEGYNERSKKKLLSAENLAFCLSELNYSSERALKKLTCEQCYQQYRLWLRKSSVFDFFKIIVSKVKKVNRTGSNTKDFSSLDEWENRMAIDAMTNA